MRLQLEHWLVLACAILGVIGFVFHWLTGNKVAAWWALGYATWALGALLITASDWRQP